MSRARNALLAAFALTSLTLAVATAPAGAVGADSLAPRGAPHNWLPKEGWVWMHWLPFEEPELAAALGTSGAGIRSYSATTPASSRRWLTGVTGASRRWPAT